jgi:hypothetical protein
MASFLCGCSDRGLPKQRWQYHISQEALASELPWDTVSHGAFGYLIVRQANTVEEREVLRTAEAVYPEKRAVLDLAAEYPRAPSFPEDELWWYTTFDDVRIPFAITAGAVEYYIRKMEELERLGLPPEPRNAAPHGDLVYGAQVERRSVHEVEGQRFENVWVVTMNLQLKLHFGSLAALDFFKERVVVLGHDRRVLAVLGDGPTRFTVASRSAPDTEVAGFARYPRSSPHLRAM